MITVKDFAFTYPGRAHAAIAGLSITIRDGEILLLEGASGSGKSTLLKALVGWVPQSTGGICSGTIDIDGINPFRTKPFHFAGHISYVSQNPYTTFVSEYVEEELAFAPINLGWSQSAIAERIQRCATTFGIEQLRSRRIATLSGGEAQKVAIAAALTSAPRYLLLDEPTSALDDRSRMEIIEALRKLNRDEQLTIVIAEHRIAALADLATSRYTFPSSTNVQPTVARGTPGDIVATANNLSFGYGATPLFSSLSFQCQRGAVTALVGPNGCGKSTVLRIAAGLLAAPGFAIHGRPASQVERSAIGYVPQNPADIFLRQSVRLELDNSAHALALLHELNPEIDSEAHPRDLSEGEKLSLALAIALSRSPALLILDEPTRGLDFATKRSLTSLLSATTSAVLMASHEADLVSELAAQVIDMSAVATQ